MSSQNQPEWEKEFDDKCKRTFVHGGLCVVTDHPPHTTELCPIEVKKFVTDLLASERQKQWQSFAKLLTMLRGLAANGNRELMIVWIENLLKNENNQHEQLHQNNQASNNG